MAWLKENEVEHEYRDILKEPPDQEELAKLAALRDTTVVGLLNPRSAGLKSLEVDLRSMDEAQAAKIIKGNPKTMFRPLLTDGKTLIVGFKPKEYEKLIKG